MNSNNKFSVYKKIIDESLNKTDFKVVDKVISLLLDSKKNDSTVFLIGNGGSSATAIHFANDLRTQCNIKAISLTDIAAITALGNDYNYSEIFLRQLKVFFKPNDILIGISASGNSLNICNTLNYVNENKGISISITGFDGGNCKISSQYSIHTPSDKNLYRPIEDCHMIICHYIVDSLVNNLISEQ